MTILEERYQISEQIPSKIGAHWKFLHVGLFIIISICGFITVFVFQNILDDFNNFCVLNAKIDFSNDTILQAMSKFYIEDKFLNTNTSNSTTTTTIPEFNDVFTKRPISLRKTRWGSMSKCNFVQYTPLVSALFALIWGTFFIILSKGGAGYGSDILPSPWRIVFPCFVFSSIFSLVVLISTAMMVQGLNAFCSEFRTQINMIKYKCIPDIEYWTMQFHPEKKPFFAHYGTAKLSAYIATFGWFFQVLTLIIRVLTFTDFKMEFVQIRDKDEEIQKNVDLTNGEQV